MVKVETSVLVNQPIEKVFEFVTTPENDAQWYIGVESRDHTPGEPAGVGAVGCVAQAADTLGERQQLRFKEILPHA